MSKRKSRLSSLDFIIMASCYSAKGDNKKALTALTAANKCEDFDTTIATLATANDASLDVEFEEMAEDGAGLSQTAIDEIEELDFESDGEEHAAVDESEEEVSESDEPQFEISNKTREKIKAGNEESESEMETEDETEDSDDLELAGFGDKYAEILAQLETGSDSEEEEEEEEEQETAAPKLSRAERNLNRLKKS